MDKENIKIRQQQILELVQDFCAKKLDQEYFELAEKLVRKLGRKRNPPFATGQIKIWAAAVIHALGTNNFLFDKSSEPYVSVDELNKYFDTNKGTTVAKSKTIRDLLNLSWWDPEFSTASMLQTSPAMNYVMVDGYLVPITSLPLEYQQLVRQKLAEGFEVSLTSKSE